MTNAVIPFDPNKYAAAAANMKKGAAPRVGFLKMSKDGEWSYGTDDTVVGEDDLVYIDPNGFVHGWQLWANTDLPGVTSELLGEVLAPMDQPLPECPTTHPAPAKGGEWKQLLGFSAVLGDVKLVYSTTSYGGKAAFGDLAEELAKHFAKTTKTTIAVVSLSSESYKHKKYGKLYNPKITVVDWVAALPAVQAAPAKIEAPKSPGKPMPRKAAAKRA